MQNTTWKIVFALLATALLASNFFSISKWSERRGVYDDTCYLRQAHLFQRFGLQGFHTDIRFDDDGYFRQIQRDIGYALAEDPQKTLCHTAQSGGLRVIQYPPGTGLIMAAFPEGFQVIPLFGAAMLIVFGGVIFLISLARTRNGIIAAGIFGLCALYLMVNPTKSSYSMAPTMALCMLAAVLTPFMFRINSVWRRCMLTALIALSLGALVSFRIPNLLLVIGYVGVLAFQFLRHPNAKHFLQGLTFATFYLIGLGPTLWANHVNAGSALSTTYGPTDVVPADFTFSIVGQYLFDIQGALCVLAIIAAGWLAAKTSEKMPLLIVGINLATNLLYFFSHPVYTQYYIMPVLTLSLWTLIAHHLVANRVRSNARDAAMSAGPVSQQPGNPALALSR